MVLETLIRNLDAGTARAFVTAARNVVDALLLEAERVEQARTPLPRDYTTAQLPRDTPGGGWLSHGELRDTARRMSEAITTEKWTDGALTAIRFFRLIGGA